MNTRQAVLHLILSLAPAALPAADNLLTSAEQAAGWQLLFNGRDLAGWKCNNGKPIATTGLRPPKELSNLDDHLVSRLLWGLLARVDVSDDESRQMIMQKLAADRQVVIPGDVGEFLLKQLPRDIPALISTLDRIVRYAIATGRKVTPRLAAEVLSGKGLPP